MTCDDYLAMLETLPIEDLMHGDAREHAAQCHDCNRVTRVVIERERSMIMAYGDLHPLASATSVAAGAVTIARRRRVAFVSRVALGVAAAAAVLFLFVSRLTPHPATPFARTFLPLRCLTHEAAIGVIRPYVSERARIRYSPEGGSVLEISAPQAEVKLARSALDQQISVSCGTSATFAAPIAVAAPAAVAAPPAVPARPAPAVAVTRPR
jgi:hypothetical protein